ncbi:MAG: DUF3667 domain-containing protein [Proteobacteria bacterium]|nr:DUF3667 domain-containing protein [Pseudomonadota bacterium]
MNAPAPLPPAAPATPAAQAAAVAAPRCQNCGTAVPQRYCGRCGQRLEPPVHSLVHFAQVAAEDLTHADSRLWRTLAALMFRPGYLTAEFLAGRRGRYLPPVRLYLVLSVAFFVFAAATQPKLALLQVDTQNRTAQPVSIEGSEAAAPAGESVQQRQDRLCKDANYDGPWARQLQPAFAQACRNTVADGGRELQAAFLHNLPRAMFLFLPLLAAVMMLLYWWPRHYYVEHLLLLVHNHANIFLVTMLVWALARLLPRIGGMLEFAACVYFAWYIFRSMRVAYGQGRALSFAKCAALGFAYLLFGALMLALTSVYSALML